MYVIENKFRKLNIGVSVSESREAMHKDLDAFFADIRRNNDVQKEALGCFVPVVARRAKVSYEDGNSYAVHGVIFINLEDITNEIISHECCHTVFWLERERGRTHYRKRRNEEQFCMTFGKMFDAVQKCVGEEKRGRE
jgi:hypothetical protein